MRKGKSAGQGREKRISERERDRRRRGFRATGTGYRACDCLLTEAASALLQIDGRRRAMRKRGWQD